MTDEPPRRVVLEGGGTGPPPAGGLAGIEARRALREPRTRLEAIQKSAQGWQTGQIAILGLLGIAGVSRDPAHLERVPGMLQSVIAGLALAAFALAASGALLIARTAWPLWREQVAFTPDTDLLVRGDVRRAQARMRTAIPVTIGALVAMGAAFALSWWPVTQQDTGHMVRLHLEGETICGELMDSSGPRTTLNLGNQSVSFPINQVIRVEPVDEC